MIRRRMLVCGCFAAAALAAPSIAMAQRPSTYKTPGATAKVKMEQLCAPDFAQSVKPVSDWQRTQALERYGLRADGFSGELDHLVPVSLGGSNDPDNLWPFHASGAFTLEAKQALASKLQGMVCARKLSLKDAQDAFRKDWTLSYQVHMKPVNAPEQE
jgi:hypothetical protein